MKGKTMKKALVLMLLASISFVFAAPLKLAKIQDYTIVIPRKATMQEKYAANILAEYLEKLCKVPATIKFDKSNIKGNYISVGETRFAKENKFTGKLAPQSYSFKVKDNNVFIRGGFPGPLNGVITLLQEDLGVRYYAEPYKNMKHKEPGLIVVPNLKDKELTVTPRDYTPPFQIRECMYMYGNQADRNSVLYLRHAPISWHEDMPENSGACLNSNLFIHTYARLVSPKKYYKDHPEYFALQNGKRVKQHAEYGAVCYTNPDVPQIMLEGIREQMRINPDACYFSVSVNDGSATQCECDKCAPLFKEYGSYDVQLMLANKVAELLVKENPEALITTLVYGSKLNDSKIKNHPNVAIFLAPIGDRYNAIKMLLPLGEIANIKKTVSNLRKDGKKIIFWDYLERTERPYPNFDQMRDSLKYLRDAGVMGYFADCSNGGASLTPLKKWVYAQLMWNPDADMEALIAEFITAYYGKAAPEITEYVALIRNAWRRFKTAYDKQPEGTILEYTVEERAQMQKLFESAMKKAADDKVLTGRIAREYAVYLNSELMGNAQVYGMDKYKANVEKLKSLLDYIPENATIKRTKFIKRCESKINFANRERHASEYSKNSVTIWRPLVVNGLSAYLDDAKAVKGKSSRHIGKKPWGIQWNYANFIDYLIPGKTYVLRLSVRPEVKNIVPGKKMFAFCAFHHGGGFKGQPIFHGYFSEADKEGKYRWINLGKVKFVQPASTGMFWMDSTVDRNEAVWYERMELIPLDEFKEDLSTVPDLTMKL